MTPSSPRDPVSPVPDPTRAVKALRDLRVAALRAARRAADAASAVATVRGTTVAAARGVPIAPPAKRLLAVATLAALLLAAPRAEAALCAGDCDDNGVVAINELIRGVNIALGSAPLSECPVFDADGSQAVEVYDLVLAVNNTLGGCPLGGLARPSKASPIAITEDDAYVVMTNPDGDSVSVFRTSDDTKVATVHTGDEPSAVVILPDGVSAFVANRADATVVEVTNLRSGARLGRTIHVGSEPTGLALSPSGVKLFVAEWAEGRVSIWDTRTLDLLGTIEPPLHPRGLTVTNDGDGDDADETVLLSEFYGEPNSDLSGCPNGTAEVCDKGRVGRVRRYNAGTFAPLPAILFQPIDSGFAPAGSAGGTPTVFTAPNQLYALAVQGGKVYATSVSAAPQAPTNFQTNVHPVVYVGDLTSGQEDRGPSGSANLAKLAEDAIQPATSGQKRFFLAEIVDLDFVDSTAYVVSRGADVLQRVNYTGSGITIGTPDQRQIDLAAANGPPACQNPIGVVTSKGLLRAYVNCWITRRLAVVDLTTQTVTKTVQSIDLPAADSLENRQRLGARFFFTGRGRWSKDGDGYSSCGSCHADGLSDNITWAFGSGPRQATSMDGSFSKGPGEPQQRIFNWSAIFDEIHDFERNTRGVSGGLGAITTSATNQCGTLAQEQPVDVGGDGVGNGVKEIQDTTAGVCVTDWDDIDEWVKTIRPPRALQAIDGAAVARGAQQFATGNCAACHGGAGWTVSKRFFDPSAAVNAALKLEPFDPPNSPLFATHATLIAPQPADNDNTGAAIPPNQVACVLRDVNTFGLPGDTTATDLVEKKVDGSRAQGAGGFNVPSLYGLAVGAPYLHHGQARTLKDVFADNKWVAHLKGGNPNFAPNAAQIDDLIAYLLSIDAETPEVDVPDGADACPLIFPPAE
jgi:DNA-binding beta-propeller fold protein YncE